MKAVALVAPGDARIVHIPPPEPAPGHLLLRVERVGLCGTDLNSFRGRNPLITYPRILGHEIAATVLDGNDALPAGTRVAVSPYTACGTCASCRAGQPNACRYNQTFGVQRDGALTERIAVPPEALYPSSRLSLTELCLVEPLTVGMHAVSRARVRPTDVVAVFGCGGVGLGAIAGSAFRGATTIAIDLDDTKLATARAAGAAHTLHSGRDDLHTSLQDLTHGHGPTVVIEAIGLPETFRAAVDEVSFAGRVVYIGYTKEPVTYETRLFVQKELTLLGSRNALPADFREVIALLESGRFPTAQAVSATVPLDHTPAILAEWSANPASFTKIVIEIR